jgi:hypothetical protein
MKLKITDFLRCSLLILGLFNDFYKWIGFMSSSDRMIVNDGLGKDWKKEVAYLKTQFNHLPRRIEENQDDPVRTGGLRASNRIQNLQSTKLVT